MNYLYNTTIITTTIAATTTIIATTTTTTNYNSDNYMIYLVSVWASLSFGCLLLSHLKSVKNEPRRYHTNSGVSLYLNKKTTKQKGYNSIFYDVLML